MAASRVAQLAASEAALAHVFERRGAFLSVMGPWPVLALVVVGYGVLSTSSMLGSLPASVPANVRLEAVVASAYGPAFVLGIAVSLPLALLVGRISYARNVRPLLAARPPRHAGAPMRCRACGGDLIPTVDAFARCRFCQTQNVLAAELARDVTRRLDEEVAAYRAQANGALAGTARAGTHMTRTFALCLAFVWGGMIVLGVVARLGLTTFVVK